MRRSRPRNLLSAVLWGLLFIAGIASASLMTAGIAKLVFGAERCAEVGVERCAAGVE